MASEFAQAAQVVPVEKMGLDLAQTGTSYMMPLSVIHRQMKISSIKYL